MNTPKIFITMCSVLLLSLLTACKEFVEIPPPSTKVGSETVFSTDATATSSLVGLYGRIMATDLTVINGAATIYPGLSADEFTSSVADAAMDAYSTNSLLSDNLAVGGAFWNNAYTFIYHGNACIEGLEKSSTLSEAAKKQLIGESKFIRGLLYFYLTNLFGDVPLVTSTDYEKSATIGNIPSKDIYAQIIADLIEAKNLMKTTYPTTDKVRPNSLAASALLARVYLYTGEWGKAEAEATTVISSGMYSLPADLNSVFIKTSPETIWQLASVNQSASAINTSEGNQFIPTTVATALPKFRLRPELLATFGTGDKRLLSWTATKIINNVSYVYPFKYKVKTGALPFTEFNVILRLAEQYLVRAEARAHLNKINDAKTDLDVIKTRAGLSGTLLQDQPTLLAEIAKERRLEYFAELGHRWLDLKRTGQAGTVLAPIKGATWQTTDVLYPIPISQLLLNPFLKQNAGYNP